MKKIELVEKTFTWDIAKVKKELTNGMYCYISWDPSLNPFKSNDNYLAILLPDYPISDNDVYLRFRMMRINQKGDEFDNCVAPIGIHTNSIKQRDVILKTLDYKPINLENMARVVEGVKSWSNSLQIGRPYYVHIMNGKDICWKECILESIEKDQLLFRYFDTNNHRWYSLDVLMNYVHQYEVYDYENELWSPDKEFAVANDD